jgi:transposase-like protein
MVRNRPRPKTILRCPRCLSYEVTSQAILFSGPQYTCRSCGYQGALILEEDVAPKDDEK